MFGIARCSVVPMRAEASERSEMVSQLLWGEIFRVEEQSGSWLRISANFDRYGGWVSSLMVSTINDETWEHYAGVPYHVATAALSYAVNEKTKERVLIPQGSLLYNYSKASRTFSLLSSTYKLEEVSEDLPENKRNAIVATVLNFLNAPYLWGGRTILGIDCSGLTQQAYRAAGVHIPRDAWQQAEKGEIVTFLDSAQPADLAFFDNDEGKVTHVGILLGDGKIIHSSASVHIDSIDSEGIFNKELNKYTHKLRVIKSLV